ncbi:MAG: hypothetical protein A2512_01545 [Deltaproteobacteria bacterium RIFOXYD12_FULL_56_24]|nr:MAG: hypothetical protein A2512_01545 [Deltaproteobacteria bacterium RIFOXYD12_FULL_56_24]
MDSEKPLAGGIPMVNIDGARIRRIREDKGLTQLYVATVVGVTTDTISRWENRRYPNIKKDNAIRLAEALESELADIIEHSQPVPPAEEPAPPPDTAAAEPATPLPLPKPRFASQNIVVLGAAFLLLALTGLALLWWHTATEEESQIIAVRILPAHATPGIPFPVIVEVTTNSSLPFSLILKETLPQDSIPGQGKPRFVFQESGPPVLKWIDKLSKEHAVYSYLARLKPQVKLETVHQFTGRVTVRSDDDPSITISGATSLQASPFHWADSNSDGRIDDEELLSVYETYGGIEGLTFGNKLIEDIWTAKGYRWNPKTQEYDLLR